MSDRVFAALLVVAALTLGSFVVAIAPPAAAQPAAAAATVAFPSGTAAPQPISPASTASYAPGSRAALARDIVRSIQAAKVPTYAAYLPNLLGQFRVANDVVQPFYQAGPAPMGIGDFGVTNTTGTPVGYVQQSRSWQAILTVNSSNVFYLDNGAPDQYGIQLNTVMTNTTVGGNSTFQYWIQNVVFYSTATQTLRFIDNIWNFSNPSTNEPATTFYSYNGTPVDPTYYYDVYPGFAAPGLSVPYPFTIHLYENSSLTTDLVTNHVWPTVRFGYDVTTGAGAHLFSGVYDTVLFNSNSTTADHIPTPMFTVNGTATNPAGLLDDAEVTFGGPGGGSTTTVYAFSGMAQLQYLNKTTGVYTNAQTAWDEGTDTGETVEGLSETYQTAGTVQLSPGPSIPMPFWNATPGGNLGNAVIQGTVTPSTAFSFFNQGGSFNLAQSAWAPVPPSGAYAYHLPPGTYYMLTYASEYDPNLTIPTLTSGANFVNVSMAADPTIGIYTPLWAWDNAQVALLSSSGAGTAASPYVLENNEYLPLVPLFGELNDFFFPVFTGILLYGTTVHVDVNQPAPFNLQYPSVYAAALSHFGFADTNELGLQAVNAQYVSVWGGSFSGWFTGFASSIPPFAAIANVAFWNVTHSLIGDNAFSDQGSALITALGGGNVIWGNTIVPGGQLGPEYEYPFQVGIQVFEAGDLIYNNLVTTNLPAMEIDENLYTGNFQVNLDSWNLAGAEPSHQANVVNGYTLTGSIVGSDWQCGNFWGNYVPGGPLPYNDAGVGYPPSAPIFYFPPLIFEGGDYCPYPLVTQSVTFTETGLTSGGWGVALAGLVHTATAGSPIVFQAPAGAWSWTVGAEQGLTATPASGTAFVTTAPVSIPITFGGALAASLTAPGAADVGQTVSFAALATGGSGNYAYSWAFGDGATSTATNPTHVYTATGTYTVSLTVADTASDTTTVTAGLIVSTAPSVTASAAPTATDVGRSVTLSATVIGGTLSYTYAWNFGDGSLGTGANPSHTYATAGVYIAHVTATDGAGVAVSGTASVTVNAAPAASASASTSAPTTGASALFTGSATGGTQPFTYAWTFGDGGSSNSQNTSHIYAAAGTYTVHLWANDTVGGSSEYTLTVVVGAPAVNVVDTGTATLYAVVALVVGLIAGAGVMAVLRRRKNEPKGGGNPPQE